MGNGYENLIHVCMDNACSDPVRLFRIIVRDKSIPMHGPVHHVIVPMVMITSVWAESRDFDLESYLHEAISRSSEVPPTVCGLWGCCGSAIGIGIFESIMTRTGPLSRGKRWGDCNLSTSNALASIAAIGGPRCCKRNAILSIMSACESAKVHLGIELHPSVFSCSIYRDSEECIGSKCPFFPKKVIPKDED
jgi:hypothetical protein